jgi:murein DD-endopeptidase MepM/ murein hydrolase activator NlpD
MRNFLYSSLKNIPVFWAGMCAATLLTVTAFPSLPPNTFLFFEGRQVTDALQAPSASELEAAFPQVRQIALRQENYSVRRGDTLGAILSRHKANLAAEKGAEISRLRSGEKLRLTLDFDGSLVALRRSLSDGRIMEIRRTGNDYAVVMLQEEVSVAERLLSGTIEHSFASAAQEAGVPAEIVDQFADLLGERIEFRQELRKGAVFSVLFEERRGEGNRLLGVGPILAAVLKNNGRTLAAIRYAFPGELPAYFDEVGGPLGRQFLRYPVKFSRISSVFTQGRFHPLYGVTRPHHGVDFAAPIGTPVRAISDGKILVAGRRGDAGIMIRLSHGDRYASAYLHLNSLAAGMRPGVSVRRGQIIGTVGMTGAATGAHLHFSLFDHNRYVNPLKAALPMASAAGKTLPRQILLITMKRLENGILALANEGRQSKTNHS